MNTTLKTLIETLVLKEIIDEATLQQLTASKTIAKYLNKPGVFVKFSEVNKFEINPEYNMYGITPKGFYGFPFTTKAIKEFLNSTYASNISERKYFLLFKVTGKVLQVKTYTNEQLKSDLIKLQKITQSGQKLHRGAEARIKDILDVKHKTGRDAFKTLWNVAKAAEPLDRRNAKELYGIQAKNWQEILITLGYDAIYDDGTQTISDDIYAQIVVLKNTSIHPIEAITNPLLWA